MPNVSSSMRNEMDSATNAYMRKVIGERLGQHLGTDTPMPDRLQKLLEELRMQDKDSG